MRKKALWKRTLDAKQARLLTPAQRAATLRLEQRNRRSVRSQSVRRARQMRQYRAARRRFLQQHRGCVVCLLIAQNDPGYGLQGPHRTTEIHHRAGRVGALLNVQKEWIPLCRRAHDWIGANVAAARKLGLIGPLGSWNGNKSIRNA